MLLFLLLLAACCHCPHLLIMMSTIYILPLLALTEIRSGLCAESIPDMSVASNTAVVACLFLVLSSYSVDNYLCRCRWLLSLPPFKILPAGPSYYVWLRGTFMKWRARTGGAGAHTGAVNGLIMTPCKLTLEIRSLFCPYRRCRVIGDWVV